MKMVAKIAPRDIISFPELDSEESPPSCFGGTGSGQHSKFHFMMPPGKYCPNTEWVGGLNDSPTLDDCKYYCQLMQASNSAVVGYMFKEGKKQCACCRSLSGLVKAEDGEKMYSLPPTVRNKQSPIPPVKPAKTDENYAQLMQEYERDLADYNAEGKRLDEEYKKATEDAEKKELELQKQFDKKVAAQ